jgi:2-iminobutanoate/2-iminopropanoate deaminase
LIAHEILFKPQIYDYLSSAAICAWTEGYVSMDENGILTATGNLEQQMKNCYGDLKKILQHYGCTFDDVLVENVFTTNMQEFIKVSAYRYSIYKKQFPTGTWLEVKGLALKGQLIEIDMEAHKAK